MTQREGEHGHSFGQGTPERKWAANDSPIADVEDYYDAWINSLQYLRAAVTWTASNAMWWRWRNGWETRTDPDALRWVGVSSGSPSLVEAAASTSAVSEEEEVRPARRVWRPQGGLIRKYLGHVLP